MLLRQLRGLLGKLFDRVEVCMHPSGFWIVLAILLIVPVSQLISLLLHIGLRIWAPPWWREEERKRAEARARRRAGW